MFTNNVFGHHLCNKCPIIIMMILKLFKCCFITTYIDILP